MVQTQTGYEPCEECGAPLDAQQRYCVECASRRGNGANPASRYFATMSKRARRPVAGQAPKPPSSSRAAAVGFFALLPIAVALGLVVGRSGSSGNGDESALLKALKQAETQTAAAAPTTAAEQPTATTKKPNAKAKKTNTTAKKSKAEAKLEKEGGKVVAKTKNGTVHQVTGYKAPPKKVEEDTKIVEENPEQTGENYIKAQQNLPDVVVVGEGGSSGGSPESSTPGVEP